MGGLSQGAADPQDAQIPPPTLLEHQLLGKLTLYRILSGGSLGQINSSPTWAPDSFVENSHQLTRPQEHPLCLGLISSSLQSHISREKFQKQYTAFAMGQGI